MNEELQKFDAENWEKQKVELRKKNVIEDGWTRYNETWEDVTPEFEERVKKCLEGTEDNMFSLGYVAKPLVNLDNYYVIYLHGGKNGNGYWNSYLIDASNIFEKLLFEKYGNFKDVWLIDWKNDCSDDVFDMWIGVKL